ncbi:MAG: hypothetical protein K0M54_30170 [Pseudomonas sp.]|uniref:DEAD/DEAH box helicase n=1 Tax=Pseudomonas sp. TaxID=306 RepID=UPI0025E68D4F|nr:DEAD/DEAH box helicase [Pseudomonas sp.]MBW8358111.1 hypothetical protein [Pseudomonas sp.]
MNILNELRSISPGQVITASQIFEAISMAGALLNDSDREEAVSLEIAVRLLEVRQSQVLPEGCDQAIEYLAEECGLYQYIDIDNFNFLSRSVIEAHSVLIGKKCYLHSKQMQALLWLLSGDNLVLSAPTSFGKSLLVDAYLSLAKPHTVLMILPTIALIDETRRRLISSFGDAYKVITSAKALYEKAMPTIFVLTQERFLSRDDVESIDLLFVDEFYKLDPDRHDSRFESLNLALYKALKVSKQSFLAGPNVKNIEVGPSWSNSFRFMQTDYKTVTVNVVDRSKVEDRLNSFLSDLASTNGAASLIFTASPNSANFLLAQIVERGFHYKTHIGSLLGEWISNNYHPGWSVSEGTKRGVAVHHGRLPRALGQFFVHLFDQGEIKVLICTSTLIEGVNTSAANVFVYDKKINRTDFDFFSFANIRGRVGRMMKHFIGNAFLYHEPPAEIETNVVVPVLFDPGASTDYIVMNVDRDALSYEGRIRQEELPEKSGIDQDTLREHGGIGVTTLVELDRFIRQRFKENPELFLWKGVPDKYQRRLLAELAVFIAKKRNERYGRISFKQVSWAWSQLNYYRALPDFLRWFTTIFGKEDEQENIDRAFSFLQACEFNFPKSIMAIQSLVRKVAGVDVDYSLYVASLENWFRPSWMKQLDEIGIPMPLSERLSVYLGQPESMDQALLNLRRLNLDRIRGLGVVDRYLIGLAV